MEVNENEFQNIKKLEDDILSTQKALGSIEANTRRNPLQKLIDDTAATISIYTSRREVEQLTNGIFEIIGKHIENAKKSARKYTLDDINNYLAIEEKKFYSERQLRVIQLASQRQAERRLAIALAELKKEKNILLSDIELFIENSKLAGFSEKEILRQLVIAGRDKNGLLQGFSNRVKAVAKAAYIREKSAAEIDQYKMVTGQGEVWVWITISGNVCPDCKGRAGRAMPLDQWGKLGIPGSGRTICGRYCRCKILPESVAEDKFPSIKEFRWDKDQGVLTTAGEARILMAKKNQTKIPTSIKNAK